MRITARKPLSLGLAMLALAAMPVGSHAQDISIVGNAQGCFGVGCIFGEVDAIVLGGVTLTYTSTAPVDFTGVTSGGELAVNTAGTSTTGSFGTIDVSTVVPPQNVSTPFQLLLSFINPITPNQVFDAVISGRVSVLGTGSVLVDYDPAPGPANVNETSDWQAFFDPLSGVSGMLRTTAFGDAIPSGGTGELTGLIQVQVIPEPASMLLLGTGLAGMLALRFRRRRKDDTPLA